MHLHWFRSDLRIHDNTALDAASSQGPVLALYIITPKQWQQHDDAACKVDLWRRQLIALSTDLQGLNIPLLIRHCDWWQDIPGVLLEICQHYAIEQVHCNAEYAVNEQLRDTAVQQCLQ